MLPALVEFLLSVGATVKFSRWLSDTGVDFLRPPSPPLGRLVGEPLTPARLDES